MRLVSGTSGFSYKEWKGGFYPQKLPASQYLAYYAERLAAVEINNTFYRMPSPALMQGWAQKVPAGFEFAVKAPQRITHRARLKETDELIVALWEAVGHLEAHLGPLLFQLPPSFRKDAERLRRFLASLPQGCRAAFEFRHPSWADDEVHAILRDAGACLCITDANQGSEAELVETTDWGYMRLRRGAYADEELERWCERLRAGSWREAYVFFKHDDESTGPADAERLATTFGRA